MDSAVSSRLEHSIDEYKKAKAQFEIAGIELAVAKERFVKTREFAREIMTEEEMFEWTRTHYGVSMVGIPDIGLAIILAIRDMTRGVAMDYVMGHLPEYRPIWSVEEIIDSLKTHGFEFKSPTPGREVNAALMKLRGIERDQHFYKLDAATTQGILTMVQKEAGYV